MSQIAVSSGQDLGPGGAAADVKTEHDVSRVCRSLHVNTLIYIGRAKPHYAGNIESRTLLYMIEFDTALVCYWLPSAAGAAAALLLAGRPGGGGTWPSAPEES